MNHEPRSITHLATVGRLKHYGISAHGDAPRPALAEAVVALAAEVVPADAYGFTIAHEGLFHAIGTFYWWADENECHHVNYAAARDAPGALAPIGGTGMACVWELEVIDFERRAWLRDVLQDADHDAYVSRVLEPVRV